MFRDAQTIDHATGFWQAPEPRAATRQVPTSVAAFGEDEVGAVAQVYREIARRIAQNAFTRHASTLGESLR
jgi:hypothetical protein